MVADTRLHESDRFQLTKDPYQFMEEAMSTKVAEQVEETGSAGNARLAEKAGLVEKTLLSSFLRTAREDADLSADGAALLTGIPRDRLLRIEIGAASPSASELDDLCRTYECDIDAGLPDKEFLPRLPSRAFVDEDILVLGQCQIPVTRPNTDILNSIAIAIRTMRQLSDDVPITLRVAEIPTIASVLDVGCDGLAVDLVDAFRITGSHSLELVAAFRQAKPATSREA